MWARPFVWWGISSKGGKFMMRFGCRRGSRGWEEEKGRNGGFWDSYGRDELFTLILRMFLKVLALFVRSGSHLQASRQRIRRETQKEIYKPTTLK
jgi:hypothetical protein